MIYTPCRDKQIVGNFVIKRPAINRFIPRYDNLSQLYEDIADYTKEEKIGLAKSFKEFEIWNGIDDKRKRYLCPLIEFYYNHNNVPISIFPRIEPIFSIEEVERYDPDSDEWIAILQKKMESLGYDEYALSNILTSAYDICDEYSIDDHRMIYDLNNYGYAPGLGFRFINYNAIKGV